MNTLVRSVYIPNFSIKLVLFFSFGPHTPLHAHKALVHRRLRPGMQHPLHVERVYIVLARAVV